LAYYIERKNHRRGKDLVVLFIVSAEERVGKTALCAGLAINFISSGRKTAYVRSADNADAAFMAKIPGLDVISPSETKGYDVVLAEGRPGKDAYDAAKAMKAKVIAVEAYSGGESRSVEVYKGFGKDLLGIVINKAPQSLLKRVREEVGARLGAAGIKLLGVIPANRTLLAITVGELAESLQGKILNNAEKSDELVENYMLGALIVDSGLDYFGRKSKKAAILRLERSDMQLAALETPTACLVLSGNADKPPMPSVLFKGQSRGIPIIATGLAVSDIVTTIEETVLKAGLKQTGKLARLAETVGQNLDIKAFN